jgi:hypothetical protein
MSIEQLFVAEARKVYSQDKRPLGLKPVQTPYLREFEARTSEH